MSFNLRKYIPNTITCLNLMSGVTACVLSFSYDRPVYVFEAYQWAFIFIGLAAVFDFLDGAAARMLHAYSDMGKELDSLADLVSFGLAPALLLYNTMISYNGGFFTWWALVPMYIVVMGALRLARFNVDITQSTTFRGLPIPSNAIFWIGFVAWVQTHTYPGNVAVAVIVALFASLMVSRMRMFSLKFKNFDWRENFRRYLILVAAVLFVATEGVSGFMWTILLYILVSAVGRKDFDAEA